MAVVKQPYGAADSGRGLAARTHAGICPHRTSLRRCAAAASLLALLAAPAGVADFVPGRVYVADAGVPPVFDGGPPDRIWEVNPDTGDTRLFATIPEEYCGALTGLAFTPDGQYLMASAFIAGKILRIDGEGNTSVALGAGDGITAPQGRNNVAYDADGDFFVGDLSPFELLRFPADGGAAEQVLSQVDGVSSTMSLAADVSGNMWASQVESTSPNLFRITGEGDVEHFHLEGLTPYSLDVNRAGLLYVHSGALGIFVASASSPTEFMPFASDAIPLGAMTLSADGSQLYVAGVYATREFAVLDATSGEVLRRFPLPGSTPGAGIAAYVPDPGALTMTAIAGVTVFLGGYRLTKRQ